MNELPSPDGRDVHSDCVWWRLSSGEQLFSTNGEVYTLHDPVRSLDAVEFDAEVALAAVAWARGELGRGEDLREETTNTGGQST